MISNLTTAGYPSRPELEEAFASQIFWAAGGNGYPCILDNLPEIPEEIFTNDRVRLVVSAQIAVWRNGHYPDFWIVEQELERRGHMNFIGRSYLADLAERPFPIVMEQALNTLLMLHRQRKLIELGEQLYQSASHGKDPEELVRQTIQTLERLSSPKTNDPNEKLRCELRLLSREEDPIVKLRRRAEIAICYGIKATDIDQAIIALRQRESEEVVPAYGIDEFFNLETEALSWLIAGLLPKKETIILSGAPKSGKSLLAIDIAFAVATGESAFLGESSVKGKVLLISVDESQQSTKAKLLKRGFRAHDKDQVRILPKWNITHRQRLEQELEDFRPDLVIVDSLRRINHGSPISENSAEFADQIYTLKEIFERYGTAGILIHHTNKDREAVGVHRLRGSSAIAGAAWGVWQLDHVLTPDPKNKKRMVVDPKDPRRILSVFPRDTEGQTINIQLELENNSWQRLDKEVAQERQTLERRITRVLTQNRPRRLTGTEIIELLGMNKEEGRSIYTALSRMEAKRLVCVAPAPFNRRYNVYFLPPDPDDHDSGGQDPGGGDHTPNPGNPPPPTVTVQNGELKAETLTISELDNVQRDNHQNAQTLSEKSNAFDKSTSSTQDNTNVSGINNTSDPEVGGGEVADDVNNQAIALQEGQAVISKTMPHLGVGVVEVVSEFDDADGLIGREYCIQFPNQNFLEVLPEEDVVAYTPDAVEQIVPPFPIGEVVKSVATGDLLKVLGYFFKNTVLMASVQYVDGGDEATSRADFLVAQDR